MRGKLTIAVGILCIAGLVDAAAYAKGKPDKPGRSKAELITFSSGNLTGSQIVEGCCPNAGPFPEYTMTLSGLGALDGEHDGQLFINFYSGGPGSGTKAYIVQFWWTDSFGDSLGIEIIGGVVHYDRKTKELRVEFKDEVCRDWDGNDIGLVTFDLYRTSYLDPPSAAGTASELTIVVPVAEPVQAGDVLVIDSGQRTGFGLGRHEGDSAVLGIVSSRPKVAEGAVSQVPVVLSGIALCKVDAGYGSILPGDLLETSPNPGHAKRADVPKTGAVLGKALEPLDVGTGLIKVLVVLR